MIFAKGTNYTVHAEAIETGSGAVTINNILVDEDGDILVDEYTNGTDGTWEKTTDGVSWGAYNTTDKANETTYIRYTPASLGDNIKVRAVLTQ